jgi:hypothetical protein
MPSLRTLKIGRIKRCKVGSKSPPLYSSVPNICLWLEVSQNTSPPILSTITEKNGAPIKDYVNANMEPKQIVLSTVWAGVVVVFGYDLVTGVAEGRYGKGTGDLLHGNLWNFDFAFLTNLFG